MSPVPIYRSSQSYDGYTPVGAVVGCSNEVPKTLSRPTLPFALDPKPTGRDNHVLDLGANSVVARKQTERLGKTTPSSSLRYNRTKIVKTDPMRFTPELAVAEAGRYESPSLHDWKSYIHPEGLVYWHNSCLRVVTEANLQKPHIFNKITHWIGEFDDARDRASFELPEAYELLLELDLQEDGCNYYVVDHGRQTVLYLDEANTDHLDLPEVCSMEHLKLKLQEQYWVHLEYFPMHGTLPASAESTMMGILTHAWGDQTTSSLSTAPYSAEQCKDFIGMLEKLTGRPDQDGYKTCMIARLMNEFLHSRFINGYGQSDGARLARNQSTLPATEKPESKALHVLSTVLLHQPHRELKELSDLWVDNIVYTEHWRAFISNELQEWKSLALLSALLLIADTIIVVQFHSHPGSWITELPFAKTGCIAGTMSLLLSMSTVVFGVTTTLVHQPYAKSHASEASEYLERASHETLGLYPLAIVLSLPRTLFIWALATAGIALLSFSFQLMDVWSLFFVGIFAGFLCSLLVWVIRFFQVRESGPGMFTFARALGFLRPKKYPSDPIEESA